ncbi:hypothetical protein F183_A26970 [Bryobacterales bacterium F-183]|nr:hypothetical protein F183_A26970 [Bryobacterales bacterium F-183]
MLVVVCCAWAQEQTDARWDAKITLEDKVKVPFSLQFQAGKDGTASAAWGDLRSSSGTAKDGKLVLEFASIGGRIEAAYDGKTFEGDYTVGGQRYRIEAAPFCTCGFQGEAGPDIAGVWALSGSGAGTLTVRRVGDDTFAELALQDQAVVKHLFGRFDGLSFALAAFDGKRGVLVDAEPAATGDILKITVQFPGRKPLAFTGTKRK